MKRNALNFNPANHFRSKYLISVLTQCAQTPHQYSNCSAQKTTHCIPKRSINVEHTARLACHCRAHAKACQALYGPCQGLAVKIRWYRAAYFQLHPDTKTLCLDCRHRKFHLPCNLCSRPCQFLNWCPAISQCPSSIYTLQEQHGLDFTLLAGFLETIHLLAHCDTLSHGV